MKFTLTLLIVQQKDKKIFILKKKNRLYDTTRFLLSSRKCASESHINPGNKLGPQLSL